MNKLFTLLLLLSVSGVFAQHHNTQRSTNMVPLNEIDSMWTGPLPGHMALQYNRAKSYNALCLDTFELFTDATGTPTMRNYYSYGMGYNGYHQEKIISQRYTSGTWANYGLDYEPLFAGNCLYSSTYGIYWTGSSWSDTSIGYITTATFDAHSQPLHSYEIQYDNGSGGWYPFDERYNHYDNNGRLIGSDHTIWCSGTAGCMFQYMDTFYAYNSYNSYCDSKPDSFVTLKLTNGQWLQNGKSKYTYYPNGTQLLYFTDNTGTGVLDSSSISIQLHDRFGNDSIYMLRNYNRGTHQWGTESYNIYVNTYDANNNLIRVLNLSDYQTTNKDSVQPYTITRYSNYVACSAGPSAISNVGNGLTYELYPNPSTGKINITLAEIPAEEVTLTITNMMGQKVKEQKLLSAKEEIQLDQPDGVYIAIISNVKSSSVSKIAIRH